MASKDKSYTMAEYFPCYGKYTNDVEYFASHYSTGKRDTSRHLPNEEMPMEEWNSLLGSLLKENGFATPLVCASIDTVDPEELWIVSVLEHQSLSK